MNLGDISTDDLWVLLRNAEKVEREMLRFGIDGSFMWFDEEIETYEDATEHIRFHLLCRGEDVYGKGSGI